MSLYIYPPGKRDPIPVDVGDVVSLEMPWSEVNMWMRVAGRVMPVRVLADMAQPLRDDGSPYCPAITHGEAGIFGRVDR